MHAHSSATAYTRDISDEVQSAFCCLEGDAFGRSLAEITCGITYCEEFTVTRSTLAVDDERIVKTPERELEPSSYVATDCEFAESFGGFEYLRFRRLFSFSRLFRKEDE